MRVPKPHESLKPHCMDSRFECIDLPVKAPTDVSAGRPRLQRLAWSALFLLVVLLVAAFVCNWPAATSWWDEAKLGDIRLTGALLLLTGATCAIRAIASDLSRLHRVRVSAKGVHLEWSHVPRLTGQRVSARRFVGWNEVASISWLEGAQDHDFRQYIVLQLRESLALRLKRMKLPVSDSRDRERCEALLSRLPPGVAAPQWL